MKFWSFGPVWAGSICLTIFACAGASKSAISFAPVPAPATQATLVGPLCEGARCACKQADDGAGAPATTDRKRFEIKLGPADGELWATVDDMILYKSPERAIECFYVDLSIGKHPLTMRASRKNGIEANLAVSELGVAGPFWYETFAFGCGGPGPCGFDELDSERARIDAIKKNLMDPCGSTKLRGIGWKTGTAPDKEHPEDLEVSVTLDVYEFAPTHPSGDAACAHKE